MAILQALRKARHFTRWVLLSFVFALGVAIASPVVAPQGGAFTLVCSAAGEILLVDDADGQPIAQSMECAVCLLGISLPTQGSSTTGLTVFAPSIIPSRTADFLFRVHDGKPSPSRGPPAHYPLA